MGLGTVLGMTETAPTVTGMCDHDHDPAPQLDDAAVAALLGVSVAAPRDETAIAADAGDDPLDVRDVLGPGDDEPEEWCTSPQVFHIRRGTQRIAEHLVRVACGSRIAEDCPYCAKKYAARFRSMARRNLGVADHEGRADWDNESTYLFTTVTHDTCGPVWGRAEVEARGWDVSAYVGAPKDPVRYGYAAQVVRHLCEPALRKTLSEAQRRYAVLWATAGYAVTSIGVREVQERGAGHIHTIVRIAPATDPGPHPGYWRVGGRRQVPAADPGRCTPDGCTAVHYDPSTGVPTHVDWTTTGRAWWRQKLEPVPATPSARAAHYRQVMDLVSHRTAVPADLVEYVGSEEHLATRRRLGLPEWRRFGLTDRTPAQGEIPARGDGGTGLEAVIGWGPQVDVRPLGVDGAATPAEVVAYVTKMLSYVAKDVGAAEGARAATGPRRTHDRRLQREAGAFFPYLARRAACDWLTRRRAAILDGLRSGLPVGRRRHKEALLQADRARAAVAAELAHGTHAVEELATECLHLTDECDIRAAAADVGITPWVDVVAMMSAVRRRLTTARRWGGYLGRAWTIQGRTVTISDVRETQREWALVHLADRGLMPDPKPWAWTRVSPDDLTQDVLDGLPHGPPPVPITAQPVA